jgi:hypothetical protein
VCYAATHDLLKFKYVTLSTTLVDLICGFTLSKDTRNLCMRLASNLLLFLQGLACLHINCVITILEVVISSSNFNHGANMSIIESGDLVHMGTTGQDFF